MVENFIRCYCELNQKNWDDLLLAAEFPYNSALTEDLGMTEFEEDLGWLPKAPVNLLHARESTLESANESKQRMVEIMRDVKFAHELSKARQSAYSARTTKPHTIR